MSDPFIGEIAIFANTYIPDGWLACNGQSVAIMQYQALYTIIGTLYGSDGPNNFKLPNLNGRAPVGVGTNQGYSFATGTAIGTETVALTTDNIPPHTHQLSRKSPQSAAAKGPTPINASDTGVIAIAATNTPLKAMAANGTGNTVLSPGTIGATGNGAAHENRQPYLPLFYAIAWQGEYPVRP